MMPTKQTHKAHFPNSTKPKQREKRGNLASQEMLPLNDIITIFAGRQDQGPDSTRHEAGDILLERKKGEAKKKSRQALVVDKKKRAQELSKVCSELRAKSDLRREQNKKKNENLRSKKKKNKTKDENGMLPIKYKEKCPTSPNPLIEIIEFGILSEVDSAPKIQAKEKKKTITPSKHANQGYDDCIASMKADVLAIKKSTNNSCIENNVMAKTSKMNSNPSGGDSSLDPNDLKLSVSSIKKRRKRKPTQAENSAAIPENKGSDMHSTNFTPFTSLDDTKSTKSPASVQSKRNLFESAFHQKAQEISPPPGSPGRNRLSVSNGIPTTPKLLKRDFVDLNLASSLALKSSNLKSVSNGIPTTPKILKRGFVDLNLAFSLASKSSNLKSASNGISTTPKILKRGFFELNLVPSLASKSSTLKSVKPSKRIMDGSQHDKDRAQGYIDSAVALLSDKSLESEVRSLVYQIDHAGGFPMTRRLSLRDNELVGKMVMAIRNDPSIKSIDVSPELFGTISSTLLEQFVRALRMNLHVKSLTFSGVELGNDFLRSLASSMESNFILEKIDLSNNLFTNEGLAEFCQIMAMSNETCKVLNIENQTTPISKASEDDLLDAFQQNKAMQHVKLDFQSEEAAQLLAEIVNRNKIGFRPKMVNDKKLLNLLRNEAERAQEIFGSQNEMDSVAHTAEKDWDHLYELSVQFDKHKLRKHIQETSEEFVPSTQRTNGDLMTKEEKKIFLFGEFRKTLEESTSCFTLDGSFLTPEFISKYFIEDTKSNALIFDFHGQWKLFKRFPIHDQARQSIVTKFVDAIVTHPRADEITAINMANTGCGDDFLVGLANRCLDDDSILSSLLILNFETNFIKADGVVALAKVIKSQTSLKFLQVVRLENQKNLLQSKAEVALARAMRVNFSIIVMSLCIRNLMERQQIAKYVMRNVELIRQARQRHMKATGQQRERNEVEKFFDRIAENDDGIDNVDLVGNKRFLTLTPEEKTKAAYSFAGNTNVKTLNLNSCGIDDEFAIDLAISLKNNTTIDKVLLERNAISGIGITALFKALAENSAIEEIKMHKQSKTMNTSEEHKLADILQPNMTLKKLGLDLRTTIAQVQLDKKLSLNRNVSLKLRAESKGETFKPNDAAFIRF